MDISADELIEELATKVSQLTMEVSAKNIVIRKLEAQIAEALNCEPAQKENTDEVI